MTPGQKEEFHTDGVLHQPEFARAERQAMQATELARGELEGRVEAATAELIKQSALLDNIIKRIPNHVFWKDLNSVYLGCNEQFAKTAGFRNPQEIVGKTDYDMPWTREEAEGYRRVDQQVMRSGEPVPDLEESQRTADGKQTWLVTSKVALRDHTGKVYGVLGMYADITERKRMEEALAQSEAKLRLLLDSTGEAIYGVDIEGRCTFCNPACLRVLQYAQPEDMLGKNMHELIHHSHADGSRFAIEDCRIAIACKRGEKSHVDDEMIWRADGTAFNADIRSYPQLRDGQRMGAVVAFSDITAQIQAKQALEESERRFMDVLRASEDAILLIDNNAFVECNEATVQMLGYQARGEILAKHPSTLSPPVQPDGWNSGEKADEMIRQTFERGFHRFEWMHRRANGEDFPVEVSLTPTVHRGRQVLYCVWRDITERKRMEVMLQTRMAAIDAAADMVVISERDGKIAYVNPAFTAVTGYSAEEAIGRNPNVLKSGQHGKDFYESLWRTILSSKVWQGELVNRRKDGSLYPEEMTITPVCDEDGAVIRFVAIKRDVTAKKQQDLLDRERTHLQEAVTAMEQVLGVVGHELRTPLAGVRALSELLLDGEAGGGLPARQFLQSIHDEVVRMSDTINDLLEVARINSGRAQWNWGEVDLEEVCADAVQTIQPLVRNPNVMLDYSVVPAGLSMRGDPNAIRRLIVNLLSNSAKHTTAGQIHVRATVRKGVRTLLPERPEGCCAQKGPDPFSDQPCIQIEVSDTGTGIRPEILSLLGEAFALNSGVAGARHVAGTGLGLAICRAVAAVHGGQICVQSSMGEGTTMTARLRADLEGPAQDQPIRHINIAPSSQLQMARRMAS